MAEDQEVADMNTDGGNVPEPEPDRPDDEVRDEITGQKRLFEDDSE